MSINYPERIRLAHLPTPVEKLKRFSQALEGPEIYIKRDDLTGMARSGNKIRKLEFLIAEARQQGCTVLITCGGVQSNHARATAVAAAKVGMKSHLVLQNASGGDLDGNLLLDRLVGAEVTFVTPQEYEHIDEIMVRIADEYSAKGTKAYIIPEGGSNSLGALGYVAAMEEVSRQIQSLRIEFDHMICAVGSGGTLAGLLLGQHAFDVNTQIHGINVCDDATSFQNRVAGIIREASQRFGLDFKLDKEAIRIIDGYVGKGYGLSSQPEIDLIKQAAYLEGIILDPVYAAKALLGVKDQIRRGRFRKGEKILFWHTGGIFSLFPKRSLFF